MDPLVLSSTAFNDAARCLKRYEYRWVHRLVRKPAETSIAIRRGTWIHRGLEIMDHGGGAAQVVDEFARMRDWAIEHGVDPEIVENVLQESFQLCLQYRSYWDTHTDEYGPYETLETERKAVYMFDAEDSRGISATADRLVRDPRGRVWLWERKSTSDIPGSDWRTIDPQTLIQYVTVKLGGSYPDVVGIIFDYVLTDPGPMVRVKKDGRLYAGLEDKNVTSWAFDRAVPVIRANWKDDADYPDAETYINALRLRMVNDNRWFQRYPVFRPEGSVRETFRDIAFTMQMIRHAQEVNHYPRALNLLTCRRFCEYSQLCSAEYQLGYPSEGRRREDFMIDTPELRAEGRSDG